MGILDALVDDPAFQATGSSIWHIAPSLDIELAVEVEVRCKAGRGKDGRRSGSRSDLCKLEAIVAGGKIGPAPGPKGLAIGRRISRWSISSAAFGAGWTAVEWRPASRSRKSSFRRHRKASAFLAKEVSEGTRHRERTTGRLSLEALCTKLSTGCGPREKGRPLFDSTRIKAEDLEADLAAGSVLQARMTRGGELDVGDERSLDPLTMKHRHRGSPVVRMIA